MSKPYILRVSSQKGGVGKTTVAVNFAAAIRNLGYRVLIIDFDFANPSVGFHLGLEEANVGVQTALAKKNDLKNIIAIHGPSGLAVIPGEIKGWSKTPAAEAITDFMHKVQKLNYDFIVVDTSPGFDVEAGLGSFDEDIIVTTPDMPSLASVVRLTSKYDKYHLRHSLVVNKYENAGYELDYKEMMDMYGGDISSVLPSDRAVPESIAAHIPAVVFRPNSRFSASAREFAGKYSARGGAVPSQTSTVRRSSFWRRLRRFFGGK